jgi:DNA polymerase III gamma/tau subunit
LLDQARSHEGKITEDVVEQMLGLAPHELVSGLLDAVESAQATNIVEQLTKLLNQGYEPAMVASQLAEIWRTKLIAGEASLGSTSTIHMLKSLLNVPAARDPKRLLELTLLEPALQYTATVAPVQPAPQPIAKTVKKVEPQPESVPKPELIEEIKEAASKPPVEVTDPDNIWSEVITSIKKEHNTLYGIARMAEARFEDQKIILEFSFAFHKKRASEPKNLKILVDTLQEITGKVYEVVCMVSDAPRAPKSVEELKSSPEPEPDPAISTISNIFGGAELLES